MPLAANSTTTLLPLAEGEAKEGVDPIIANPRPNPLLTSPCKQGEECETR